MEEAFGPGPWWNELKLMTIQLSTAGIEADSQLNVDVTMSGNRNWSRGVAEKSADELYETKTAVCKQKLGFRKTSDVSMQNDE